MMVRFASLFFLAVFAVAPVLRADEETEALRQQIKVLEARLEALERKQAAQPQATPQPSASSIPASPSAPSGVATPDATAPTVAIGNGQGLTVTSPDKNFKFRVGGYVQADDHAFISHSNPSNNSDQFLIRSARPIFEAQFYQMFSARLMLDYGNGQTTLLDAYGDYNADPAFNFRVGKFKDPIGIERWQQEQNILFTERGMTTNLVPYRDNGVEIYGTPIPHALEYQLALTNGAPDLVNATNNTDNDLTVTGRIFVHPLYGWGADFLDGLGVGMAASYGGRNASLANPNLTTGYVTPAQSKFFTYGASVFADGEQWRLNPQMMYYNGPFSLIGEYVLEQQGLKSGAATANIQTYAWEGIMTYVLTGEDARFDGVVPKHNFNPQAGDWGAFELVGRISGLRVDDAAFPVFASLASSAKAAQEATVGGTWYMNANVKLNLDLAITRFDGGAATGDRPTEKALLSRVQFRF